MLQSALQHIPHTTYHIMAAAATVASNQQVTRATGVSIRHASTSIHKCRNGQKQSTAIDALTPMTRLSTKSPPVFRSRSFLKEKRPLTPHRQWLIWVIHYTRARFLSVRWTCRTSNFSTLILLRVPFPSSLPSCGTGGRQSC